MLAWAFLLFVCVDSKGEMFPLTKTENATFTVYLNGELKPAAEVKVERIFKTYEKKGFFQIGALPMMVATNVQIELIRPEALDKALATVRQASTRGRQTGRFELRHLEITSSPPSGDRLRADFAQFEEEGRCKLRGGVKIQTGTNSVSASSAILQVTGPQAGTIQLVGGDYHKHAVVLWR